jgi:holo-[acyl-carrier protein] synthase
MSLHTVSQATLKLEEELTDTVTRMTKQGQLEAIGLDIVELEPFTRQAELGGARFLHRVFTSKEIDFCQGRWPQLAVRFAAKEACAKALGTGLREINWREIEVVSAYTGEPSLELSGRAAEIGSKLGIGSWKVSLTHTEQIAAAVVIGFGKDVGKFR